MLRIGMFLGDRYEILEKIGSGGMADVYKAKCHKLNRYVAVKVLKPEHNSDRNFVNKFKAEGQAAAGLSHPNIVNIYDVGDEEDIHYIVMELIEGITLKKCIEQKGKLEIRESIAIAMQIAQGIEAAHNQHIVHRDIKPQNIIIAKDNTVKVTDFGIAKAANSQTINSNTMGSVHYISPEQARGGYCDERSDIYSLGITLYEMLTGRVPFDGDSTVSVALLHIQGEMPMPREVDPLIPISLEKIILKCTQKKPERRYTSISLVIADLKRALMTPNEDFVKMAPAADINGTTRIMSDDEMQQIKQEAKKMQNDNWNTDKKEENLTENIQSLMKEIGELEREENPDPDDLDDYEDEEDDSNTPFEKIMTGIAIALGVIIIFLAIFGVGKVFGFFNFSGGKDKQTESTEESSTANAEDKEVEMPNLIGKDVSDAEEIMKNRDLKWKFYYEESKDYEENQIIAQEIEAGEMVKKFTVVKLTVSSGTTETTVPSGLAGMNRDEAQAALEKAGLDPVFTEEYSDTMSEGLVTRTNPSAGTICQINSQITVFLSKGKEIKEVQVPYIVGKTEAAAIDELARYNLSGGIISTEYSSEYEAGYVISQSIQAGSTVNEGTKIDYVISKGMKTVQVPDLRFETAQTAKEKLEREGLKLGTNNKQEYSNTGVPEGQVISQTPAFGTTVSQGTAVDIVISLGPEPTTEPEPTAPAPSDPTDNNGNEGNNNGGAANSNGAEQSE